MYLAIAVDPIVDYYTYPLPIPNLAHLLFIPEEFIQSNLIE